MRGNCQKCGLPIGETQHICIHKSRRRDPPRLEIIEGSEIAAVVDASVKGIDGVFRPVLLEQDDGACLTLTIEDAQRLYDFLDEAIPFLEGKIWQNN